MRCRLTVRTRPYMCRPMRLSRLSIALLLLALLGNAGCGGDNLALCEGCEQPTATPTVTPSATPTPTESPDSAAASPTPGP